MSPLSATEAAAVDAIDTDALLHGLAAMVAVPSITGSAAESELLHQLGRQCDLAGLDVDLWMLDLPALAADPDWPGTEVDREEAHGLVASTPQVDGPTVVLQGHVDVVPAPNVPASNVVGGKDVGGKDVGSVRWSSDPFTPRLVGRTLYARGACDMKAGVAANLAAVAAIRASGVPLPGRLALHFVGGEEDGGLGAFATLRRGHRGDACLISEPTSGTLMTAAAGALTFTLTVPGRPAHASSRWAGASALDHFVLLHGALAALEAQRCSDPDPLLAEYPVPYALSIGVVHAGEWASTVPDRLTAQGRLGVRLDEDPADARESLEQRVAEVCASHPFLREHPAQVAWTGGQFASGRTPPGHPLPGVVAGAHADLSGAGLRERGAPYGSDLRLYAAHGVPTLHYGPGDVVHAHAVDERVDLDEVVAVTRVLVVAALRLLGAS